MVLNHLRQELGVEKSRLKNFPDLKKFKLFILTSTLTFENTKLLCTDYYTRYDVNISIVALPELGVEKSRLEKFQI